MMAKLSPRVVGALIWILLTCLPSLAWASNQNDGGALLFLAGVFLAPLVLAGPLLFGLVFLTTAKPSQTPRRSVRFVSLALFVCAVLGGVASVAAPLTMGFPAATPMGAWILEVPALALSSLIISVAHLIGTAEGWKWTGLRVGAWMWPVLVPVVVVLVAVVDLAGAEARDTNLVQRLHAQSLGTDAVGYLSATQILAVGAGSTPDRHLQVFSRGAQGWVRRPGSVMEMPDEVKAATIDQAHLQALAASVTGVWRVDLAHGERSRRLPDSREVYASTAISGDGRLGAAAGDGEVRVWSLADGELVHRSKPMDHSIYALTFSSDGSSIVASGYDAKLVVIDLRSGVVTCELTGVGADVLWAEPSSDTVLSGSRGPEIRRWNIRTCHEDGVFVVREKGASALSLSPDGRTLAVGDRTSQVFLYDYPNAGRREAFALGKVAIDDDPNELNSVRSIAFRDDGAQVVAGSFGTAMTVAVFSLPSSR